jgi:predicted ATPase
MRRKIERLTVKGFKSIREVSDFPLGDVNVIVGANGAGKSNFVQLLQMVRAMRSKDLQNFVATHGGSGAFLHNGLKVTKTIEAEFCFGEISYNFRLTPTADETFAVSESQHGDLVGDAISRWVVYHFHDTSDSAPMRQSEIVEDCAYLREDAANIAPFLKALREDGPEGKKSYGEIVDAVRLVMPFLDDFTLTPVNFGPATKVKLTWKQKGTDYPFQPYHLSDGAIRFICLATALLQPKPPSTIIIDEPELGLHPQAISILADLIKAAASRTQVIVATQSPLLVDQFSIGDIIVAKRKDGATAFERLNEKDYSTWLEDFTLGELWTRNVIEGGPAHEQ